MTKRSTQDTINPIPTILISHTLMPCRSGRVVKQPDRFIYLEKSFKAILKEHEIDPIDFNKIMSDVDAHLWQKNYGGRVRILVILM